MRGWLREVSTAVLRRAEDIAVEQAQRYVEEDRPRDAVKEYRTAQVFAAELNRRSEH